MALSLAACSDGGAPGIAGSSTISPSAQRTAPTQAPSTGVSTVPTSHEPSAPTGSSDATADVSFSNTMTAKRAKAAHEFLAGVFASLSLQDTGDEVDPNNQAFAETFEGRPVFTFKDPSATLRVTQEKPYRLVSLSQGQPSTDGSQLKLVYFSEEGKESQPLTEPTGKDVVRISARLRYSLNQLEAAIKAYDEAVGN